MRACYGRVLVNRSVLSIAYAERPTKAYQKKIFWVHSALPARRLLPKKFFLPQIQKFAKHQGRVPGPNNSRLLRRSRGPTNLPNLETIRLTARPQEFFENFTLNLPDLRNLLIDLHNEKIRRCLKSPFTLLPSNLALSTI